MSLKLPHKKDENLKRIWPKGYKRFDSGSGENFEVKPQKYNFKLILLSLFIAVILWFLFISPYLNQTPKKEGPIKVKIFTGTMPSYTKPKPK